MENKKEEKKTRRKYNEFGSTMPFITWKITYMQQQYSSKKRLSLTVPNVFVIDRVGLEKR